ncbi:N-acyl homoserine lactonase family protein [Hominifimenecus sp. rT4P-3]|uniref:N-acyl homoserine lactonase family protein n=1 Tax=Hominifimenecus sp. rT4P-3 TaxID=3242979 RepID=UPI003DA6AA0A
METWKLELLYLGKMRCKKHRMIRTENREETMEIPVTAVLLRHPQYGNILYDTGNAANWASCLPEPTRRDFPITEWISIESALREKGLSPDEIDVLILSHLHFDHVGGLQEFAGTKAGGAVRVSRSELSNALVKAFTGYVGGYVKSLIDVPGITYMPVDQEMELFPGLRLFLQQSHAPGLIGLEVKTEDYGTVLCVSDAVYLQESDEKQLPPDSPNQEVARGFLENLKELRRRRRETGAVILYGHDWKQTEAWVTKKADQSDSRKDNSENVEPTFHGR